MTDRYTLLSLEQLFGLTLPELTYVVDGILPRGASGLLTAREKAGKGLLAVDLLASVAGEEPFIDRAVAPCRVAYFAAEENIREVRDRIAQRVGAERTIPFFVVPLNAILADGTEPERLKLDDPVALQRLGNTIKGEDIGVAVLDTLREMHDQPENDSDYMGPLLRPVRQIAHELNATILTNHHHNRNNTSRGSTAIKAAVDFEWSFVRTDDADNDANPPAGRLVFEGRWPRKTLFIALGDGLRWRLSAAPVPVVEASVRDHILGWLDQCQSWQTATDIAATLSDPSYKLKTVQNTLSAIRKEAPCPVAVKKAAGRGGPIAYHCLAPTLIDDTEATPSPNDHNDPSELSGTVGGNVSRTCETFPPSQPLKEPGQLGKFEEAGFAPGTCFDCGGPAPADGTHWCGACRERAPPRLSAQTAADTGR